MAIKDTMNLGISGSTIQVSVLLMIAITIAPIILFFGVIKLKSELNKRKEKSLT
jgi:hypothetical protein